MKKEKVNGKILGRIEMKNVLGGKKQQVNCNSAALGSYECLSGSLEACRTACYRDLVDCTGCD